jgi:hypothetical protein
MTFNPIQVRRIACASVMFVMMVYAWVRVTAR